MVPTPERAPEAVPEAARERAEVKLSTSPVPPCTAGAPKADSYLSTDILPVGSV